jgi:molybdopterin adenylyltransferase
VKAAAITVSSSRAGGSSEDLAGPRLVALAEALGAELEVQEIVPDDRSRIEEALVRCAEELGCRLILTSGGTGLAPDDITPEATRAVIEREAPGIAEALRLESRDHTRHWMLSRGVAGMRGGSLIVNLPGSPDAIDQAGDLLTEILPHALSLLSGERPDHR